MRERLFAAVVLCMWVAAAHCSAAGGDELTVVFTGDTSGKLMACSCPNDPYGGLAERVSLIGQLRQLVPSFLLVEPGRMVSLFGEFADKSALTMELMNMMGYDAAGIDTWEIFHGVAGARTMRDAAAFPLVSASVAGSDGVLAFDPLMVKDIGDARVAVIGLADSTGIDRIGRVEVSDFSFLTPEAAIAGAIERIPDGVDFVVVLSTLPAEKDAELLENFPEIDLLVETNGNRPYLSPVTSSAGVIVNPGGGGQYVGAVTIVRTQDGGVEATRHELVPVIDIPADPAAETLIDAYYERIGQKLVK